MNLCACGCGKPAKGTYHSNRCQQMAERQRIIDSWLSGQFDGVERDRDGQPHGIHRSIRQHLIDEAGHRCSRCGWSEVNPTTGKVPLQIHHEDGDAGNCSPRNVSVLCPNCHSVTPNWGRSNKKATRPKNFTRMGRHVPIRGDSALQAPCGGCDSHPVHHSNPISAQ
jgi:hypothetical protein